MIGTLERRGQRVKFVDIIASDHIDAYIATGLWYEECVLTFIESLKVEGNYVDAGAYIGNHSLFFSLFCPSALVFSFEPQHYAFKRLSDNLQINNAFNCLPLKLGLSDEKGRGMFHSSTPGNMGMATLLPNADVSTTEIVTLDSLGLNVKLMKVDVEGMEMNVLRGAEKTLEGVEHLFVEIPPDFRKQDEIIKFLAPKKFRLLQDFVDEQIYYFRRVE